MTTLRSPTIRASSWRASRSAVASRGSSGASADSRMQLRELATLDPVTGLLNRRSILDRAHAETARSADEGRLDGALRCSCSTALRRSLVSTGRRRPTSCCERLVLPSRASCAPTTRSAAGAGEEVFAGIRWGGDELLLVIPGKDVEAAAAALERLRTRLSEADAPGRRPPTARAGVVRRGRWDFARSPLAGGPRHVAGSSRRRAIPTRSAPATGSTPPSPLPRAA